MREQRWKLIWHEEQPENVELFDLDADPLELDNVAAAHPDVVARLKAFLDERGAMVYEPPSGDTEAASTEALKQLGYIEEDAGGEGGDAAVAETSTKDACDECCAVVDAEYGDVRDAVRLEVCEGGREAATCGGLASRVIVQLGVAPEQR